MNLDPLWLSLKIAVIATIAATLVGVPIGTWLANRRVRGRLLIDAILTAPMVLPPTVLGYYVLVVLGRRSPIGQWYESLTGSSIVFTQTGACVAAFLGALPFVVKSVRAAVETIDPRYPDAARTLGASPARVFWTILIPLAAPGIATGVTLGFARGLGEFGVTLMVAGNIPGQTQTASLAIYDMVILGQDADAAGLSLILAAIAVLAMYAVNRLGSRFHGRS